MADKLADSITELYNDEKGMPFLQINIDGKNFAALGKDSAEAIFTYAVAKGETFAMSKGLKKPNDPNFDYKGFNSSLLLVLNKIHQNKNFTNIDYESYKLKSGAIVDMVNANNAVANLIAGTLLNKPLVVARQRGILAEAYQGLGIDAKKVDSDYGIITNACKKLMHYQASIAK